MASWIDERISHAEIAERAYVCYLERGASNGLELDDWLRAERELSYERNHMSPAGDPMPQARVVRRLSVLVEA